MGPKSNIWYPSKERRQTQGDRTYVRMETETWHYAATSQGPRSQDKLEEAGETRAFGGSTALLASGFQRSRLQN